MPLLSGKNTQQNLNESNWRILCKNIMSHVIKNNNNWYGLQVNKYNHKFVFEIEFAVAISSLILLKQKSIHLYILKHFFMKIWISKTNFLSEIAFVTTWHRKGRNEHAFESSFAWFKFFRLNFTTRWIKIKMGKLRLRKWRNI